MDPKAIHETLVAKFGEKITGAGLEAASPFAVVAPDAIAEVAAFCKAFPGLAFDNLMCLSGVDYPKEAPPRMEVVYHLYSYTHLHTFALKVQLPRESPAVPTVEIRKSEPSSAPAALTRWPKISYSSLVACPSPDQLTRYSLAVEL